MIVHLWQSRFTGRIVRRTIDIATAFLSDRAVAEDIVLRPQLGDL